MSREFYPGERSVHDLMVYESRHFRCVAGVNHGDGFDDLDTLCAGDSYKMRMKTEPRRLHLLGPTPGTPIDTRYTAIDADKAALGPVEATIGLTMMTETGALAHMRVLDMGDRAFLLPLGQIDVHAVHTVIEVSAATAPLPLADPVCLAFARGTRLTLQDGSLKPVEDLTSNDALLSRDGLPSGVVGVLSEIVPAIGRTTRVVIRAGAFSNESELVVSAAHRLFVPARRSELTANGPDRMEPAFKLVNGLTITAEAGGSAEYFHVLLDRHEVIYAEGIPCESFLLDATSRAGLSETLAAQVAQCAPRLIHAPNPASLPPFERVRPARTHDTPRTVAIR